MVIQGMRNLDESGLEGNNNILRGIRTKLAMKTSQSANLVDLVDTIRRLDGFGSKGQCASPEDKTVLQTLR